MRLLAKLTPKNKENLSLLANNVDKSGIKNVYSVFNILKKSKEEILKLLNKA